MRTTIILFVIALHFCHAALAQLPTDADRLLQLQFSKKKNYYNYIHETSIAIPKHPFFTAESLQWLFSSSREFLTFIPDKRPPQAGCPAGEYLPLVDAIRGDKKLTKQLLRIFSGDEVAQLSTISIGAVQIHRDGNRYVLYRDKENLLGEAVIRREVYLRDSLLVIRTTEEGSASGEEVRKMFSNKKLMDQWWQQTNKKFIDYALNYYQLFDATAAHPVNIINDPSPAARCRIKDISGSNFSASYLYDPVGRISSIRVGDGADTITHRYVYDTIQSEPLYRLSGGDTLMYKYDEYRRLRALEYHHASRPGHQLAPTRIFIKYPGEGMTSWTYPSDFDESLKYDYQADSLGVEAVFSTFVHYESRAIEKNRSRYLLLNKCREEVLSPVTALYGNVLGPIFEFPVLYFSSGKVTGGGIGSITDGRIQIISVNTFGYPTGIRQPGKEAWQISYDCL